MQGHPVSPRDLCSRRAEHADRETEAREPAPARFDTPYTIHHVHPTPYTLHHPLVSEHRQQIYKDILTSELKLKDTLHYLEQTVQRYHQACEELKLVPLSNKNARGQDYSIIIDTKV
ncbi:hypothetical protein EON63_22610 [archaeon]|nr:MAG: hypothetical protein EON63_22610 [archaeon]